MQTRAKVSYLIEITEFEAADLSTILEDWMEQQEFNTSKKRLAKQLFDDLHKEWVEVTLKC